MEFVYTIHVEENMAKRCISKTLVELTVLSPEKALASRLGRVVAQRVVGGKLLRVVYEEEQSVYIIITAYYAYPERYKCPMSK
jgi:hypothetical protein